MHDPIVWGVRGIVITPKGMLSRDTCLFAVVRFLVYVPVMMLGMMWFDLTSKKAVGTAAGFVGLFVYLRRVVQDKGIGWIAQDYNWNYALYAIFASTLAAIIFLAFTWKIRPKG